MTRKLMIAVLGSTILAAAPSYAQAAETSGQDGIDVIALQDWHYDDIYTSGMSAERLFDRTVIGRDGEEIGDVEELIIGRDGQVLSLVAEVGGFWDIGDVHVSVPFDQVEVTADKVAVPVTEDTVDTFGFWSDDRMITADRAESRVIDDVDNIALARAWRASELIGDYARVRNGDSMVNYGYINDFILLDGEVSAVIVEPAPGTNTRGGYRAYPYYGYGWGWNAGSPYYDMPYTIDEIDSLAELNYDRIN